MRTIRNVIMILSAFLLVTTVKAQETKAAAGNRVSVEDRAKERTRLMSGKLALTPEQLTSVQALNLDFIKKWDAAKNEKANAEQKEATKKKLGAEYEAKLKTILNADQYAKYLVWKEEEEAKKAAKTK